MELSRTLKTTLAAVAGLALAAMVALAAVTAATAQPGPPEGKGPPEGGPGNRGTVDVQIQGINDFEGNLLPTELDGQQAGGAAYLAAYLDEYQEKANSTIRVHAGDMAGASPLISGYFFDEPAIRALNLMGFDVGAVGNHDLDEGPDELMRLLNGGQREGEPERSDADFEGANFPYLAANTVYEDTGEPLLEPYEIVKRKGAKVGFIGVITPQAEDKIVPDAIEPFEFLDISETVNRYSAELERKGVDSVVVLAHESGSQEVQKPGAPAEGPVIDETRQMSDAVDLVVGGDTSSYVNTEIDGKRVVQSFDKGTSFNDTTLTIDRHTSEVVDTESEIVPVYTEGVAPDPEVQSLVDDYSERIAEVESEEVGEAAEDITTETDAAGESALGSLIADAQRQTTGADIAFMNPGGIRTDIQQGSVTYGDLYDVQPFDNAMVTQEFTGAQILSVLEQQFEEDVDTILQPSGIEYAYDANGEISDATVNGEPLDEGATYTVAANNFLTGGGDGFTTLEEGTNPETLGSDLDALVEYIEGLSQPFSAPEDAQERITAR